MEKEKDPSNEGYQKDIVTRISMAQILKQITNNYAFLVGVIVMTTAESGNVQVKDIELLNGLVDRLITLSSLTEKEQMRSCGQQEDFARPFEPAKKLHE